MSIWPAAYAKAAPFGCVLFQRLIQTGTRDGSIEVVTPLIRLSKTEIIRLGLECKAPLELTWSCYKDAQSACGVCESCVLRLRAFSAAQVPDPIPYQKHGSASDGHANNSQV